MFSPDQRAIVASIVKKAGETAEKQKGILVGGAGQFNPRAAAAAASGGGTTSNAGGASGSDIPPRPKPTKQDLLVLEWSIIAGIRNGIGQ